MRSACWKGSSSKIPNVSRHKHSSGNATSGGTRPCSSLGEDPQAAPKMQALACACGEAFVRKPGWLLCATAIGLFAGVAVLLACKPSMFFYPLPESGLGSLGSDDDLKPVPGLPWFEDVTAASGIDFHHYDSATSMNYIHETMGSGLAWIDYNND